MPSPASTTLPTSTAVMAVPNCSICSRIMDAISSGLTATWFSFVCGVPGDAPLGASLRLASFFRGFQVALPFAYLFGMLFVVVVGVFAKADEHRPALDFLLEHFRRSRLQ